VAKSIETILSKIEVEINSIGKKINKQQAQQWELLALQKELKRLKRKQKNISIKKLLELNNSWADFLMGD
jgi:hypothetical protein